MIDNLFELSILALDDQKDASQDSFKATAQEESCFSEATKSLI